VIYSRKTGPGQWEYLEGTASSRPEPAGKVVPIEDLLLKLPEDARRLGHGTQPRGTMAGLGEETPAPAAREWWVTREPVLALALSLGGFWALYRGLLWTAKNMWKDS